MQDVLCNSSDFYYHIQGVFFCNSNKLSDAYGFSLGSNAMEITAFVHCGQVHFKNLSCSSHCVISIMKSTSCCRYVWSSHAVPGLSYYLVMPVWSRFKSAHTIFFAQFGVLERKNMYYLCCDCSSGILMLSSNTIGEKNCSIGLSSHLWICSPMVRYGRWPSWAGEWSSSSLIEVVK
jgi:hypothetical protein